MMNNTSNQPIPGKRLPRRLSGIVTSDKMDKTVVVKVVQQRLHSKLKRYYRRTKKFKAHDERNEYHIGDAVMLEETRPLSREKRWRIISRASELTRKTKAK